MLNPKTVLETYYTILETCGVEAPLHPYAADALIRYIMGLWDVAMAMKVIPLPDSKLIELVECLKYGPTL